MKLVSTFLAVLFGSCAVLAQEVQSYADSTAVEASEEYIEDHKTQLNIKFEVSNDINAFLADDNGNELVLQPNLDLRYALVFSYKFLSVRFGFRPRPSDTSKVNRGDSDTYRLRLQMLFDNWSHQVQYDYDRGFYVNNTLNYFPDAGPVKVQFPYMISHIFFGSSAFKLNENYSVRSIQSQTEIQVKSAGSLLLGVNYSFYSLSGTDRVLLPDGEVQFRDPYSEYTGFSLAPTVGYYYTFVWKRYWFVNAYAAPSAGIDTYTVKTFSQDEQDDNRNNDFFATLDYGVGGGYNGEKFFFGAELVNRISSAKYNANKIQFQSKKNSFSFYFGYRFRAPKTVRKPVDLIEEKIPILKR